MQDSAIACPKPAAAGRLNRRSIATGAVGLAARTRKTVAPNSPRHATNPRPAPAKTAERIDGSSIRQKRPIEPAPSNWPDSPSDAGSACRAGSTARTTNGIATSIWAIGTSQSDPRRSSGGLPPIRSSPSPSVVADTPRGSSKIRSAAPPGRWAMTRAARTPSSSAALAAALAVSRDRQSAESGSMLRPVPAVTEPRCCQFASPKPVPTRSERSNSAAIGKPQIMRTAPTAATTAAHSATERGSRSDLRARNTELTARRLLIRLWILSVAITATS
ncbi:unannotated protein [freshwater metagenome]|uniref:Unannotated protein n=1 Tax=freshwater metagenome TaxID=449393 RepID=A0A6J7UBG4_9ZZZZ